MKFYEFGKENKIKIMFLHGNMVTHRQFDNIVPLLKNKYHVICVDFDGFDETGETTYTTAKDQADKIATYIKENLNGRIDLVQAESLGSAPAVHLSTDKSISVGGVIFSGAQYLDYGSFFNSVMMAWAPRFTYKLLNKITATGKVEFPKFLLKKMGRTNEELQLVCGIMAKKLSYESLKNTFHEGLVLYRYVAEIEPQTHVATSCWYGENEKNMKKAVKALKRAYPNIEIHPFAGLGHGSIVDATETFVKELELFLKSKVLI